MDTLRELRDSLAFGLLLGLGAVAYVALVPASMPAAFVLGIIVGTALTVNVMRK